MRQAGFTLIEALVAVSILGIVLTAILPSFLNYMDTNTLTEVRSGAVAVAQETMEGLRQADPGSLPSSGYSGPRLHTVGKLEFESVTRYCTRPQFCGANSRQMTIEVMYGGQTVYTLESVHTRLK